MRAPSSAAELAQPAWLWRVEPAGEAPAFVRPDMLALAGRQGWPFVPLCDQHGDHLPLGARRVFLRLSTVQESPKRAVPVVEREAISQEWVEAAASDEALPYPEEFEATSHPLHSTEEAGDAHQVEEIQEASSQAANPSKPGHKPRR